MSNLDPATSAQDQHRTAGDEVAGRDFLIRSEEQLHVGTERVPAGRARLEKFVVTETKTITVQVSHEEIRLVRLDDHSPQEDRSTAGHLDPSAPDPGRWLTLSREEVEVVTKVVAVERVRLEVYPVTEQQQITEQVRKEQIDAGALPTETPSLP